MTTLQNLPEFIADGPPWVLVSGGFHAHGGQPKANAALADYLLGRGTPVHLVGHDIDAHYFDRPGCTVCHVPRPLRAYFLGELQLRRQGLAVARQVCARWPGTRVLVNGGGCDWPDINWVHYIHAAWHSNTRGAPLWFQAKSAAMGALGRRHERRALTRARLVITNSERTRRDVVERLGLDGDRVRNVYLGAHPDWRPATPEERAAARSWLGQPEGRPLVVFLGGFGHDERKGFDTLWAAWRQLCLRPNWDADLLAAGDGPRLAWWKERVAQEGLGDRVRLLGFTQRVFDLLAAADLLVSPVRYEPYGLNVQEAVSRGVPALVSACAGVVEQYSPELTPLVLPDPEDADDLAGRLLLWRDDLAGWRVRFRPLSEALRSYTWADMAARIVTLAEGSPPEVREVEPHPVRSLAG